MVSYTDTTGSLEIAFYNTVSLAKANVLMTVVVEKIYPKTLLGGSCRAASVKAVLSSTTNFLL